MSTHYKPGTWNALCDVCGFQFKSDRMRKRWDGLMVCHKDFEQDHPQKYLRVSADTQAVPWVREQPSDTFIQVCYLWERSAYTDLGTADCMTADNNGFTYLYLTQLKNAGIF